MTRYTPLALSALLSLISCGETSAWTSIPQTASALASVSSRIRAPTTGLSAADGGFVDLLSDGAAASAGGSDGAMSVILSALRSPLTRIVETQETLNKMESGAVSDAARALLTVIDGAEGAWANLLGGAAGALPDGGGGRIVDAAVRAASDAARGADREMLADPTVGPALTAIQERIVGALLDAGILTPDLTSKLAHLPPAVQIAASAAVTFVVFSSALGAVAPPNRPYPMGKYDPVGARAYFDARPAEAVARAVTIGTLSAGYGLGILQDFLSDKLKTNADRRAEELSALLTKLGPTFIKVGQSLSIRTDLLSPAYVRGLKSLQDQVPSFPTVEAREILEEELGKPVDEIFSEFSEEPVAAASLGQVYRARLRGDGREVAIKVQRPDIMNQIALDMHLLREFAPWAKRTFNLNTDTAGTVDVWGAGFVDELDYISEARNGEYFEESIQTTPLAGVVFSPPVIEEFTTGKVLTTEWVIGERLDKSSSDDVTILCSIAMNAYLTMMLETGVLHCDPHPGNLLRTPDGKLCILDWGMVTRLNDDLQITLIEHMAHLTSRDYDEIPRDLLLLGFIPESKAGLIKDSGIVEVLADIYGAWTEGGGAAAIDVNKVITQLQDLTATRGNLFQIPPYFAYIAKSFSVLEGIGLSNDAQYSIINECLPYVSKRLLTDKSERTGGALSMFIFGPNKGDLDTRIVDYDRVEQLITGFGDYTTSASGASLGKNKSRAELINDLADQILELLATEEETPLQEIFIEQLAKIISSSSRTVWADLRERSGTLPSGRSLLGAVVDPLGIFRTSPVVRSNELDEKTVETTRGLIRLAQSQLNASDDGLDASNLSRQEVVDLATTLVNKVWDRRRGIMNTSNRLARALLKITADKLEKGDREILGQPTAGVSKEAESA